MTTTEPRSRADTSGDFDGDYEVIAEVRESETQTSLKPAGEADEDSGTEEAFEVVEAVLGELGTLPARLEAQGELLRRLGARVAELEAEAAELRQAREAAEAELAVERGARELAETRQSAVAVEKAAVGSQLDATTARLCHAEELIRAMKENREASGADFSVVEDGRIAAELAEAEARAASAERRVEEAESEAAKAREDAQALARHNQDLTGHVAALEVQVLEDRAYIRQMGRQGPPKASAPTEEAGDATLTETFVCQHCDLRICDHTLFQLHSQGCHRRAPSDNNH